MVIKEQAGTKHFDDEEELRRLAIRHCQQENGKDLGELEGAAQEDPPREAVAVIARMSNAEAYQITKAFATFFELTNLAETNHRKRRSRAHRVNQEPKKPGTLRATLERMREVGIDALKALGMAASGGGDPRFHRPPHPGGATGGPLQAAPHLRGTGKARPASAARGRCGREPGGDSRRDHRALAVRRGAPPQTYGSG